MSIQNRGSGEVLLGVAEGIGATTAPDLFLMIESTLTYIRAVVSSSGAAPGLERMSNSFCKVAVAF